jgi:hypothetical protein
VNINVKEKGRKMLKKISSALAILALATTAQAATVTEWNTNNVELNLGPYEMYSSYVSPVYDFNMTEATGGMSWKERDTQFPGLSVVTGDDTDGTNCIMSAGYNPHDLSLKQCSDPWQSSKRFKSVMSKSGDGMVLKFNVDNDGTTKTYRMLQKLSNWTGGEVTDFTIELGFVDANGNFTSSTAGDGLGLSDQDGIVWSEPISKDQVLQKDMAALMAHGLFGAPDKHHTEPGYFNPYVRGEFDLVAEEDQIVSNGLSSAHTDLFGQWKAAPITITGMYWDHDELYYTDNILMANCFGTFDELAGVCNGTWETYRMREGTYIDELTGEEVPYTPVGVPVNVSAEMLATWAADPWVAPGPIDDFANINLNYFITVGDIPSGSFAMRFTPNAGTDVPDVGTVPAIDVTEIDAPEAVE